MTDSRAIYDGWLLALTCTAGLCDARSGRIPNWLTLPTLGLAPLAHALCHGSGALAWSVLGAVLCAIVPLALFARGAMGGGDVKLFAAAGALVGPYAGLELQMASYGLAAAGALVGLALRGELWRTLGRSLRLLASFGARKADPEPNSLTSVRLGAAVFAAAVALAALRAFEAGA